MKVTGCFFKLCLTLTLIAVPFQPVFAQEFSLAESPPIFLEQKNPELELALFKEQKDPWRATGLNLIPFGVGSFQQGDYFATVTILILDGLASAVVIGHVLRDPSILDSEGSLALANVIAFSMFWGFARVVGIFAPYMHYYAALKDYTQKHTNENKSSNQTSTSLTLLNLTYTF